MCISPGLQRKMKCGKNRRNKAVKAAYGLYLLAPMAAALITPLGELMDDELQDIQEQQDRYERFVYRLLILNVAAWTFTLGLAAYLWGVL